MRNNSNGASSIKLCSATALIHMTICALDRKAEMRQSMALICNITNQILQIHLHTTNPTQRFPLLPFLNQQLLPLSASTVDSKATGWPLVALSNPVGPSILSSCHREKTTWRQLMAPTYAYTST